MNSEVIHGDCLDVLRQLPDDHFDSCVTDPPYGIGFMGKQWDSGKSFVERKADKRNTFDHVGGNHNPVDAADSVRTRLSEGRKYQAWCEQWAAEVFRVLKPGAHIAAFSSTRTYHRMAVAIEDAGFEIRDSLHWIYGSGFPKSLDVSKAIDKAARGVPQGSSDPTSPNHGKFRTTKTEGKRWDGDSGQSYGAGGSRFLADGTENGSVTELAEHGDADVASEIKQWSGWGTALKPAHEPIVLARKPLAEKTVAANVLAHGTGALNIDGCRVRTGEDLVRPPILRDDNEVFGKGLGSGVQDNPAGRFPPNILLTHSADCQPAGVREVRTGTAHEPEAGRAMQRSIYGETKNLGRVQGYASADGTETIQAFSCAPGCPVAGLDGQSGNLKSPKTYTYAGKPETERAAYGKGLGYGMHESEYGDTGGASRFFPQFTWDPLYDLPFMYCAKAPKKERPSVEGMASHPTVKPLALMRWLVRLITPPEGTVLDPFAGTGTTGQAARDEDFGYVLIEREPDYIKLINKRLYREPSLFDEFPEACV